MNNLVDIARDAFGHLSQGISVLDRNLKLVFYNQQFLDLLEFPAALVRVGTSLETLLRYNADRGEYGPGDPESQVRERMDLARQFTAHSFLRERPSGEILQIDGNPMSSGGFVTTYTDITEKVQHEAFLKGVIEASPAGFGISGVDDGRLFFFNSRLAEMFGMTPQQMEGIESNQLYAIPGSRDEIVARASQGEQVRDFEALFRRLDGSTFCGLLSLSPTTYQGRSCLFAWVYDIDSLKSAQEAQAELQRELHQAQKLEATGQLAAGIAHEINTPAQYVMDNLKFLRGAQREICSLLQPVLPLLDTLPREGVDSALLGQISRTREEIELDYLMEEIPLAIEQSLQGIGDVASIVRAMKEFSHPGEGEMIPTDINHLLQNTLTVSRSEWKSLATVTTDLDPDLALVPCNAGELGQVFLNLVINAAHAIEALEGCRPGEIHISTRSRDGQLLVEIEDNGVGIPEANRERIFEPFFTTKEVGRGTGQGLSISHHIIVNKHAGEIGVSSQEGNGTRFWLCLPLA
ncbi:MAG: PAS-domain containing protein [Sedimenticola sp.]|nr:PAS-domain containing protein [Sedimenticola sp.]